MNCFLTGATGFVGARLAERLAEDGHEIKALFRNAGKLEVLGHSLISPVQGHLLDVGSLRKGMEGCEVAFHLAAFAQVWAKDTQTYHRINVEGTRNVLEAARQEGVKRVILTSTAGVFGPGSDVTEITQRSIPFFTLYEETKARAEAIAREYSQSGLEVVIVNPTRVYGPGQLSESNAVTRMVRMYCEGKWRFLPGDGGGVGNYVYVEDVVDGHLLAWRNGRNGERYILGGSNASYVEFFNTLAEITGKKKTLYKIPIPLMMGMAKVQEWMAEGFGREPLITPPWVRRYLHHWSLSSEKAVRELGYNFRTLTKGLGETVTWLEKQR